MEEGWLLPSQFEPVLVSQACCGSDFWLLVVALLAWQLAPQPQPIPGVTILALLYAAPLSLAVNSIRIVVVVQAHRWFIPLWPEKYAPFFHQLTGVAVFLPALIFLHALLEHSRSRRLARNQ